MESIKINLVDIESSTELNDEERRAAKSAQKSLQDAFEEDYFLTVALPFASKKHGDNTVMVMVVSRVTAEEHTPMDIMYLLETAAIEYKANILHSVAAELMEQHKIDIAKDLN